MKSSLQCLSINAYGIINTKWSITEVFTLTFNGACARTKLILYIASIVKDLIELIADLNISINFCMRLNKELVIGLTMLKLQVQLLGKLADNVDNGCLWGWEKKPSSLVVLDL